MMAFNSPFSLTNKNILFCFIGIVLFFVVTDYFLLNQLVTEKIIENKNFDFLSSNITDKCEFTDPLMQSALERVKSEFCRQSLKDVYCQVLEENVELENTCPDFFILVSFGQYKSLIVWSLSEDRSAGDTTVVGRPLRALRGHGHYVSDIALSSDGKYALSGSWDKFLRLWDLTTGRSTRRFGSHTGDVLSVSFSADNRQIVSGSRDRTIKLWNTLAQCKHTIIEECHTDWVSAVRFSPSVNNPAIVSGGWDRIVKVWNLSNCRLKTNHVGHSGFVSTVTVSPDGSLCASSGKDGASMLWDLNEGKHLYTLHGNQLVNSLAFSPNRYWLCAAVGSSIKVWDLETKTAIDDLKLDVTGGKQKSAAECTSLAWSADGQTLFSGYTDNVIRIWQVTGHD